MDERIHKWLLDIKKALDEIDSFLADKDQDFFYGTNKTSCLSEPLKGNWKL